MDLGPPVWGRARHSHGPLSIRIVRFGIRAPPPIHTCSAAKTRTIAGSSYWRNLPHGRAAYRPRMSVPSCEAARNRNLWITSVFGILLARGDIASGSFPWSASFWIASSRAKPRGSSRCRAWRIAPPNWIFTTS